jgi:mevalonate kinase
LKSIASAPGKIILLGEHFVVYGSKAILAAIDKRVTVTSSLTEDKTIKIKSRLGTLEVPISSSHEEVKSEFRPFVYLANKLINSNQNVNGMEIEINSDIPVGVGLGSSSACCVAATASIYGLVEEGSGAGLASLQMKKLSSEEIVEISIEAEKTIFPDTSGADCTVCTYGGMIVYDKINGIEKIDSTSIIIKDFETVTDLNFIIANSMIPHSTKRSVERVKKFKENNEEEFSKLCEYVTVLISDVLYELKNEDDEYGVGFVGQLGMAMSSNQGFLARIGVSNATLNSMRSALRSNSDSFDAHGHGGAGLLNVKITGAGDGGCIIALVEDRDDVIGKLADAQAVLGKDKECFSAKIDTKGVVWNTIYDAIDYGEEDDYE